LDCYRGENLSSEYFTSNPDLLEPTATPTCQFPNYGTEGSFFNLIDATAEENDPGGGRGDFNATTWGKAGRGLEYDAEEKMCTFMGNFTWDKHQCILDPTFCQDGFSVSLWVNMTWQDFTDNSTVHTFISTGKWWFYYQIEGEKRARERERERERGERETVGWWVRL
jgi:hypothetical protein